MLKLTPSRVREFQACPHQYRSLYVDKLGPKGIVQSAAFSFGCSEHAALNELYRGSRPLGQFDPEVLLRRNWRRDGYANQEEEDAYFTKGVQALAAYGEKMLVPIGNIIGTEVFLSRVITLEGRRFELGCKADRLEVLPDGTLEVLDYKTSSNGEVPSADMLAADLATFLYYALARVSYPNHPHVVVSQLNLLTLAKTVVDYTPEQITANKSALVEVVDRIEAGQFEPRPNGHCAWCVVKAYCPLFGPEVSLDQML